MSATKASAKAEPAASKPSRRPPAKQAQPTAKTRKASPVEDLAVADDASVAADGIDLEHYVPAYLTWVANKLSRSASQHYLRLFDIGIETWRCMVLLAVDNSVTAQKVSQVIGMDKGSVSRCFKSMQARGLITLGLEASDGRLRMAKLTSKGRALHEQIRGIALERERALLSVLSDAESETLLTLLKRLHENLPEVESATQRYVDDRFPGVVAKRSRGTEEAGGH